MYHYLEFVCIIKKKKINEKLGFFEIRINKSFLND